MSLALEKVLEISRRRHNGLTPKEMADDLTTEGWQRKQGDNKKREWQSRGEDDRKIKEVPKKKKSQIGEEVLTELRRETLRSYMGKAVKSSANAYAKNDRPTMAKRARGLKAATQKLHPKVEDKAA